MFFRIITLLVMVVSFQACSIKYKSPSISKLIHLEYRLMNPYNPIELKDNKINNILKYELYKLGLPDDFAYFKLIETGIPTAYTGVSNEIYITKSFIEALNRGLISENEFKLILIHEILHKKLRHCNKSLSSPELTVSEITIKKLVKASLQVAAILYLRNHGEATNLQYVYSYLAIDEVVEKFSDKKAQRKYRELLTMPFLGYSHSEKDEFIVDEMVVEILHKRKENVEDYQNTLVTLKRLLETTSKFKVDSRELNKLNIRIEKLNKDDL